MKKTLIILSLFAFSLGLQAQEEIKLYNPELDGIEQIDKAIAEANASNKQVFIQLGGNWCPWCILFNKYVNEDQELKDYVDSNYVVVHLNWSRENNNTASLERLDNPQRFGYPVFVILDKTGKRIHTQDSALLEEGKSYNRKKVMGFFQQWTVAAVDPLKYKK